MEIRNSSRWVFLTAVFVAHAGVVDVQGQIGDRSLTITESRMPTVLTVQVEDLDFTGFPVDIPFTMTGSPATVYLAVYTNLAEEELPGKTVAGDLGWHTYQGINTAVYVSPGFRFEPGSHTIRWDGWDHNGNAVSPQASYRYFLVALDDQAPINMVGYTNMLHNDESCFARDQDGNFYTVTAGETVRLHADGPRHLILCQVGTNWVETKRAWQAIDVEDELFQPPYIADVVPAQWTGGGNGKQYGVLPGDFYGAYRPFPDGPVRGAIKFHVDPEKGQVTLDKDFGTEGNGLLRVESLSGGNHPALDSWKDRLYFTTFPRKGDNFVFSLLVVVEANPPYEVVDVIDLAEWFVRDVGDGELKAVSSRDLWVDDTGIWLAGYAGSVHLKLSLDGELRWVNDNGDGFADRIDPKTGAYDYGSFAIPPWNTSCSGGKSGWGFAFIPLLGSTTSTVDMLGPDGTGILHFAATHAPDHWPQWVETIEEEGGYDGLYFDIGSRREAGDRPWNLPDFTGFPARQAIHMPYDTKTALLNPGAVPTVVEAVEGFGLPTTYVLEDAVPNPANPRATIRFSIPQGEYVTLQIYNSTGQRVKTLHEGWIAAGMYQSVWDGTDDAGRHMGSGVYLYRLEAGAFLETKKLTLIK